MAKGKVDPGLVAGGIFTGLVTGTLIALHLGKPVCPRVGHWPRRRPDILVYRGCQIRVGHVEEAVAKLREAGLTFGLVQQVDSAAIVPGAIVVGPIDRDTAHANTIANASWSTQFPDEDELQGVSDASALITKAQDILAVGRGGEITHAYIGIDGMMLQGRDPVRVIAHELVHADGLLHTETAVIGRKKKDGKKRPAGSARWGLVGRQSGNLMHPLYESGGWKLRGIGA